MKRILLVLIPLILIVSMLSSALADGGLVGQVLDYINEDANFRIRGYLQWGMDLESVEEGLKNEVKKGEKVCTEIEREPRVSNWSIWYVKANTILGEYKVRIWCTVSMVWGLYNVDYDFVDSSIMEDDEWKMWQTISDDDYLEKFETLEKTINYVYGIGERVIDEWEQRNEAEDDHYIIKTHWSKGGTNIYLESYKESGIYHLNLEYCSPNTSEYKERLNQDLRVKNPYMFYGF